MWRFLVIFSLVASSAFAQVKPIGLFGADCATAPAWASFGHLAEWDDFGAAATCARARGSWRWVLLLYGVGDGEPLGAHVHEVRRRADAAGLTPFLHAVTYREEWYEHWRHGLLRLPALRGLSVQHDEVEGVRRIRDYLTRQHAEIRAAWPAMPIAWITTFTNDTLQFGPEYYAPVPGGVDVLALDPYSVVHQSFAQWQEVVFRHAVNTTTLPLVIIPQWFAIPGSGLARPPNATADYLRWLQHPRVLALWGFTWESRPGIVGLRNIPELRLAVESSMKERR